MDNSIWAQIKRGLKVTGDYFIALIIFGIFSSIVFSLAKENIEKGLYIFSIVIFIILIFMVYSNMSDLAFKEKRPQYKINPPQHKGFIYGAIGILPVFLMQLLFYVVQVPEEWLTIKRRVLQALTSPLYWLAKSISGDAWAYHLVLLVIPLFAGLGYLAGHYEFYMIRKLKIFDKLKKIRKKPEKK